MPESVASSPPLLGTTRATHVDEVIPLDPPLSAVESRPIELLRKIFDIICFAEQTLQITIDFD